MVFCSLAWRGHLWGRARLAAEAEAMSRSLRCGALVRLNLHRTAEKCWFSWRLWKNWHRFETIPFLRLLGSWTVKYDFKLLLCSNIGTYMCIYIYINHWEPKLWNGRMSWIGIDKYKFYLPEDGAYSWWQLCVISPLAFRHQCPSTGPAPGYYRSYLQLMMGYKTGRTGSSSTKVLLQCKMTMCLVLLIPK